MNFLSHFYFERKNPNVNMVLGVVLPDFVKNSNKGVNLYPGKCFNLFSGDDTQLSLNKGWARHIKVDALFHSSDFFALQTQQLKQLLLPIMEDSPVKPFFLAHIALELMLDHLLIVNGKLSVNSFYDALEKADKNAVDTFLQNCKLKDTTFFFNFLNSFISERYLFSYQQIGNLSYALNSICKRLWINPFTENQILLLTEQLVIFMETLDPVYLSIFDEIEQQLE